MQIVISNDGAEGGIRTRTRLPSTVFEFEVRPATWCFMIGYGPLRPPVPAILSTFFAEIHPVSPRSFAKCLQNFRAVQAPKRPLRVG